MQKLRTTAERRAPRRHAIECSLIAIAIGFLTVSVAPALATHDHPASVEDAVVPFVRAFAACPSGSCPSVPLSPFTITTPGDFGWFKYKTIPSDISIKVNVRTVLDASSSPFNGTLSLAFTIRMTDHDCTPPTATSCTVIDLPFPVTVPCGTAATPSQPPGRCVVNSSVNAILPGMITVGKEKNIEFGAIEVSDPNALLFMKQGFFVP